MSDEELRRRMGKGRRLWDHHGSWLLLVVIGISCFMAGGQFQAYSDDKTLKTVIESHERQDKQRVERIRELLADNKLLTDQLGPKVERAAKTAERAAAKAEQAVEKAAEASPLPPER